MKNRILLAIGAVALTVMTFNATAGNIALSPRAAASQIKTAPAAIVAQATPTTGIALSPRAAASQSTTVTGVANDQNPALACRNAMTGSPKAVEVCASNPAMPACNATVAVAPLK